MNRFKRIYKKENLICGKPIKGVTIIDIIFIEILHKKIK